jgi:hypothetical protein
MALYMVFATAEVVNMRGAPESRIALGNPVPEWDMPVSTGHGWLLT